MTDAPTRRLDEGALRAIVPRVLAGLVRRGEDFDAAEDALQEALLEALLEALRVWPEHPADEPGAWLASVATRRLVDARRSEAARHRREEVVHGEPPQPGSTEVGDDTLFLLFCCCHPDLAPASQVALTLRAVGGLTTREIADAFYVPEATMAQRISRAKRTLRGRRLNQPGDLAVVLRVLYLIYTAGHAGRVDLAGEAIRLPETLPEIAVKGLRQAGGFDPPQLRSFEWQRPSTREQWLDELPTSGLLTRLPQAALAELLAGIAAAIDTSVDGNFTARYTTVAVTAQRTIS